MYNKKISKKIFKTKKHSILNRAFFVILIHRCLKNHIFSYTILYQFRVLEDVAKS